MPRTAAKPAKYTPEFKLEVLEYSDKHTPREAIEHYELDDQTVFQWRHLRKKGQLKLPTTNEAIASLTEHTSNGHKNGKRKTPSGLPMGYKARVVARIRTGESLPHLAEVFDLVDMDTLKEWRRVAKKTLPYSQRVAARALARGKKNLPARVEVRTVEEETHQGNGRTTFRATPEKMFERAQMLEFLLSFLLH